MFNPQIEVVIPIGYEKTALERRVWKFMFWDNTNPVALRLVKYTIERRKTTRHKWKAERGYDAYDKRTFDNRISIYDVPLPVEVMEDARKMFLEQLENIQVEKWN